MMIFFDDWSHGSRRPSYIFVADIFQGFTAVFRRTWLIFTPIVLIFKSSAKTRGNVCFTVNLAPALKTILVFFFFILRDGICLFVCLFLSETPDCPSRVDGIRSIWINTSSLPSFVQVWFWIIVKGQAFCDPLHQGRYTKKKKSRPLGD